MRFGINTFLWTANFGEKEFGLLPDIKVHGFDGIEVTLIRQEEFAAGAIRRALAENELGCTVCSVLPNGYSLLSEDAETRARSVTRLERQYQTDGGCGCECHRGTFVLTCWAIYRGGGARPMNGSGWWRATSSLGRR